MKEYDHFLFIVDETSILEVVVGLLGVSWRCGSMKTPKHLSPTQLFHPIHFLQLNSGLGVLIKTLKKLGNTRTYSISSAHV